MAEGALIHVAGRILKQLAPTACREIRSWWKVNDELEKLRRRVSLIQAVLADAEERSSESSSIREWLALLKEAFYEAEDLLDEISTDVLRRQVMTGNEMARKVLRPFLTLNQVVYSFKMVHKIKKIRKRLEEIEGYGRTFDLVKRPVERLVGKDREQTHSRVPEIVVGRDGDKETIIELLLSSINGENVETISIVGIGGLGKTTLAQIVLNDEKVKAQFELRLWVCVGDNFDVKLIVQKILGSLTHEKQGELDMDPLLDLLHKRINGKKYLIVLDDVWNEDPSKWFKLKDLLVCGARGSKIIITTRAYMVAEISRPILVHNLKGLSERDSWELFKKMAFKIGQVPSDSHEKIGKEIMRQCSGVPLAIRAIGCLLYSKSTIEEWLSFKNKELLKISLGENSILPILKLSYNHLPSHLKHCFAYCCLFPKDHKIHVPTLKNLWMAQGYVQEPSNPQCLEDICDEYFMDLLWRSFFQEVEEDPFGNIETCKMHDLMHDVATEVAGKEIMVWRSNGKFANEKIRHLSFYFDDLSSSSTSWKDPPPLLESRDLRTFIQLHESMGEFQSLYIRERQLDIIFSNLRRLRVLDLHNLGIHKVPNSLKKLKHLRHLDLSYNWGVRVLPDSIIMLQNLEVLVLDGCKNLQQLPTETKKLVNLSHLSLSGCENLSHMPHGLGRLTSLSRLSMFVVGRDKYGAALDELGGLNNLRGELQIEMGYVNSQAQFRAANLKEKRLLQKLMLKWDIDDNRAAGDDEMALEALEPHQNLKRIYISGYNGLKFQRWVSSLSNLVEISLSSCWRCNYLPPLYQLPCLRDLSICDLKDLEYMEQEEFNRDGNVGVSFFPSLEILTLQNCYNLTGWWKTKPLKTTSSSLWLPRFHLLSKLRIADCPNMTLMPLFPPLKTLEFGGASLNSLVEILHSTAAASSSSSSAFSIALSQLQVLRILSIDDIEFLPEGLVGNLISLKTLSLYNCPRLKTISQAMQHLTSLEELEIRDCVHLELDDDDSKDDGQKMQTLQTLRSLDFWRLHQLESLPTWIQHALSLQKLEVRGCDNLKSLPDWMPKLTSLQNLIIYYCPQLRKRCGSNKGEDWPKIAHIPNITVYYKVVQRNGHYLL